MSSLRSFWWEGSGGGFVLAMTISCKSAKASPRMFSARVHPEPIDKYMQEELRLGHIFKLDGGEAGSQGVHVSRFRVIPKIHQLGKCRLITDPSVPKSGSVNDGISPSLCSVSYTSVDDAVWCILSLGRGVLLVKFDIASVYRIVPVHTGDRLLLGMRWKDDLHVDGALPIRL